jgi:hypothetical protein
MGSLERNPCCRISGKSVRIAILRLLGSRPQMVRTTSRVPVTGFAVIEAADLDEAIEMEHGLPSLLHMMSSNCGHWSNRRKARQGS